MYVSTIHPGFLLRCPKLPRLKSKIYGAYWTRGIRFLRLFVQHRNCTPLTKNRFGHLRTCSCGARMGRTSSTTHLRSTAFKHKPAPLQSSYGYNPVYPCRKPVGMLGSSLNRIPATLAVHPRRIPMDGDPYGSRRAVGGQPFYARKKRERITRAGYPLEDEHFSGNSAYGRDAVFSFINSLIALRKAITQYASFRQMDDSCRN